MGRWSLREARGRSDGGLHLPPPIIIESSHVKDTLSLMSRLNPRVGSFHGWCCAGSTPPAGARGLASCSAPQRMRRRMGTGACHLAPRPFPEELCGPLLLLFPSGITQQKLGAHTPWWASVVIHPRFPQIVFHR